MAVIPRQALYPIDEVLKTIYAATIKADPPRVAPIQLDPVVTYLEDVTKKSGEHLQRMLQTFNAELSDRKEEIEQLLRIKTELGRWQLELALYRTNVNLCIATGRPNDNECTLWTVTAPLFFGIYDGPLGTSSPRAPGLRAPFLIANQLAELQSFANTEGLDAWRYIGEETGKTFAAIGETVAGSLRLMAEVAGKAAAAAAGGLLAGLGPMALLGIGLAAWLLLRGKKE